MAATFTADPIEPALRFWLEQLGFDGEIVHAPYNQVFQALLDPTSVLAQNDGGVNLVLVRFEDFWRFAGHRDAALLHARVDELLEALRKHATHSPARTLLWVGPASDAARDDPATHELFAELDVALALGVRDLPNVHMLGNDMLAAAQDAAHTIYDARRDEIGHIPYTPVFFTALATACARRIHAMKSAPIKVIALDCDNTLWDGVVGEEGVHGIGFSKAKLALQAAMVAQQEQGVVLCLCSKNAEDDVLEVFAQRNEMPLKREHLVSWRVNWQPKAQNLAELATELNLGLDSFVFIDDNPVECAQVRAAHPQVLTLQLPEDDRIEAFLSNLWVLDRLSVTEEDRQRTRMYQENTQRSSLQRSTSSIADFLASLELHVDIAKPSLQELARIAQLTGRTNQFNFTTVRRDEAEIAQIAAAGHGGLECLRVIVRDRFGEYGLVGVIIFGEAMHEGARALQIDTMLLSCRVLGRGVEHAMLRRLGELAQQRGTARIVARYVPTKKNRPALDFLESLEAEKQTREGDTLYAIDAGYAAGLEYRPGADAAAQLELARSGSIAPSSPGGSVAPSPRASVDRSAFFARIHSEWDTLERLHAAIEASATVARPALQVPWVAPRSALERDLAEIWQRLLFLDRVGVRDDFAELGGTSLMAAQLFVEIEERFGIKLPMTTILDAPTIEALAERMSDRHANAARDHSVRPLRKGLPNGPKLFLVHDGDGETLLYMNLARRLPADVHVFGIEPLGDRRVPIRHTRIADMAAHYVELMTREDPEGPYAIGGMCAGGTIAFEMALQLEARGKEVRLVALLDSAEPQARPKLGVEAKQRLARFVGALRRSDPPPGGGPGVSAGVSVPSHALVPGSPLDTRAARLRRASRKLGNLVRYEATRRMKATKNRALFRMLRQTLDRKLPVLPPLQHLSVRTVYELAEREYVPAVRAKSRVVLFRATDQGHGDDAFMHLYEPADLGWSARVQRGLEILDVPGGHSSMLQEPHVAAMAARLRDLL